MKISLTHLSNAITIGFSYSAITTLTAYVARKKFPELSHFFYLLSVTLFTSGSIAYLWKEYSNKTYINFQRESDTFSLRYPSIYSSSRLFLLSLAFFKKTRFFSAFILGSWTGLTLSWKEKSAHIEHQLYYFI
jgi:hypothetical protein